MTRRTITKKYRLHIAFIEEAKNFYSDLYNEIDIDAFSQFGFCFPDLPDESLYVLGWERIG